MAFFDLPLEQLRSYVPSQQRPADIDAFWEATLATSAATPLDLQLEQLETPYRGAQLFRASYSGWGGTRVAGAYARPVGDGPFPAVAIYHGYSWHRPDLWDLLPWVGQGYAVLAVDVRGQGGESGDTAAYPGGHAPGFMTMGISSREHYYYRGVYVDAARAIEVLAQQPEVDASRIGATGVSQGGALTLVAAALDKRVRAAVSEVPFLCDFRRATTLINTNPYHEIVDYFRRTGADEEQTYSTLSYFDCANLAPRISGATLVTVGLMDEICPPSTVFAAYNQITAPKEIFVSTFGTHVTFPGVPQARARWFAEQLA